MKESTRRFYLFASIFLFSLFFSNILLAETTYKIRKGDTLTKISKKLNVSVEEILQANDINPKTLRPGTKIRIPTMKKVSPSNTIEEREEIKCGSAPKADCQEDFSYHIVKTGDTLYALSKKYSISISDLNEINTLRSSKIKPGQQLVIKRPETRIYMVKKGDTLSKIARQFHIDLDELMDMNALETDMLKPGQKILLEPEVKTAKLKTYETIISQAQHEDKTKTDSQSESPDLKDRSMKEKLILFAKKLLDIPYRFGGSSLFGIDCSAFVQKVYSLVGINLPRSAREQFHEGNPVEWNDLSIGDLVFFQTYASFPSHVGIYLGDSLFIHASSKRKKVTIDNLETPYYLKRFIGAKRLIDGEPEKNDFGRDR